MVNERIFRLVESRDMAAKWGNSLVRHTCTISQGIGGTVVNEVIIGEAVPFHVFRELWVNLLLNDDTVGEFVVRSNQPDRNAQFKEFLSFQKV